MIWQILLINFFSNVVKDSSIFETPADQIDASDVQGSIQTAIDKYKNHPALFWKLRNMLWKKKISICFDFITKYKISKGIRNLDSTKSCKENDIPVKIIKNNDERFSRFIYSVTILKETRNSFKKRLLNLWWIQTKTLWKLEMLQKPLLLKVFFTKVTKTRNYFFCDSAFESFSRDKH